MMDVYLCLTSGTPSAGSVEVTVNPRPITGQAYKAPAPLRSVGYAELAAAEKVFLGQTTARRYMQADVKNVGTTATLGLTVRYELTKVS